MINFDLLHKSIGFYQQFGFERIEAPWTVTAAVSAITKPPDRKDFALMDKGKVLVASGEQSFLYLYLKGFLPKGRFQTITPCFRDEPFDSTHTKYFLKNELIITDKPSMDTVRTTVGMAKEFFEGITGEPIKVVSTSETSYDIYYNDIELGSYGIRECDFLEWVYGTGIAEPRTSAAIKKYGLS